MGILMWLIYGLVVGLLAKFLHPGDDPVGFLPTLSIGVAGSYMGGLVAYLLGHGLSPLQPSGLILGILGGIICLTIWRWYKLRSAKRSFFGKLK